MAATIALGMGTIGVSTIQGGTASAGMARPEVVTNKRFTLTATFTGGAGLTAILMSPTGRTLSSVAIATSPKYVTFVTPPIASIAGSTIQLVNSKAVSATGKALPRSGDYFGPVVLAWAGTERIRAYTVYEKLAASVNTYVPLGGITVQHISGTKQGHAYANTNVLRTAKVDTRVGQGAKARYGRPLGVGNYGRTNTGGVTKTTLIATSGGLGLEVGGPDADATTGGDLDDDGIPNAFDVNDDGDTRTDASDPSTPRPQATITDPTTGVVCGAVPFSIFTNYKATQGRFAGTINYYGTGDFQANRTNIASTIDATMTMVFSKITNICGHPVTKVELKGIGVPYAPSVYTVLPHVCVNTGDYQWHIGLGEMCAYDQPGRFPFGPSYAFSATDLPSGQDTFSMRVTTDIGMYEFAASPGFVFVTHPMLAAYGVAPDAVTTPALTPVDYTNTVNSPDGTALAADPPISVGAADTLWLKIYRPQRLAFDGEASASGFVDLGGYRYTPDIPTGGVWRCETIAATDSAFTDTASVTSGTKPTLILKWHLGDCYGSSPGKVPWSAGETHIDIQVEPSGPGGNAAQKIIVTYT